MENGLTATSGSGTQTATQSPQSPQTSTGSGAPTTGAHSVQPGTATDLLNGSQGVALHSTALSTVSLSGTATQTQAQAASVAAKNQSHHHANPVFLGFSCVLFVAALVICWLIARPVKNTIK